MNAPARRLRELLAGPDLLVVPESYDALSARLVEHHGYSATYCGGGVLSAMALGLEDNGIITTTELVRLSERIAASIRIPLICDADQAGETLLDVRRTIRSFERAGIAGVHIEDSLNPKHLSGGNPLRDADEMSDRVAVAAQARCDDAFVVIARTDALREGHSVDDAIERGRAYAAAGADLFMCVFIPATQLARVVRNVPIPVLDINQPVASARAAGLKVDLFAGHAQYLTARLQDDVLRHLRAEGDLSRMAERKLPGEELALLLDDAGTAASLAAG